MDGLIQRIRWAMNLTLLGSLLLLWALAQEDVTIMDDSQKVINHAESVGDFWEGFRQHVPDTFGEIIWGDQESRKPRDFLIRSTKVEDIIRIQEGMPDQLREYVTEGAEANPRVLRDFKALTEILKTIEQSFNKSGIERGATVGKWVDLTTKRVRIPIIDERVDVQTAIDVFSLASTILWLYLGSCIITLRKIVTDSRENRPVEWLFLHAGLVGPILGSAWVLLPAGILIFGMVKQGYEVTGWATITIVAALVLVSVWILWEALCTRLAVRRAWAS